MTTPKQVNEPIADDGQLPANATAALKGSMAALRLAAARARQLAEQTRTDLVVMRAMPDLHESNYK